MAKEYDPNFIEKVEDNPSNTTDPSATLETSADDKPSNAREIEEIRPSPCFNTAPSTDPI